MGIVTHEKYLHTPRWDFALLGGGSLLALLMVRWASELLSLDAAWSLGVTLMLANVINNPHFACSYLIFYGGFDGSCCRLTMSLRCERVTFCLA